MTDYRRTFDVRGALYNRAGALCPEARAVERRLLVDLLGARPGEILCDVPAGGGYLAAGLVRAAPGATIVCLEPSQALAAGLPRDLPRVRSSIEALALGDESVDRLGSLAGLHHVEDRASLFDEAYRVLKLGGRCAVADLHAGSAPARFLNGPVDRLTETGHRALFFERGELEACLARAGFRDVVERYSEYAWTFPDRATLVAYCRLLFGLVRADAAEVERLLEHELGVFDAGDRIGLRWSLLYAAGTKPGSPAA
jgi:ubiquinone/menaquinone biosynthesis C-methylase UbiE